ncbi:MAG: phosphoribosylformylglycinamidine synthase [Euryarchaeota archaeon]|nr:phosphoribosylformylglycinamidine synthase [Euryarchaeota archaeon]
MALRPGLFDAQGHIDERRIRDRFGLRARVEYRKIFTEDLDLPPEELSRFAGELAHPVTHTATLGAAPARPFDHVIEVGYRPGVMDPEGRSAKLLAGYVLGRTFPFERRVAVQHQRLIRGALSPAELRKVAGLFSNDTVQTFRIWSFAKWKRGIAPYMPTVRVPPPGPVRRYDLDLPDGELLALSAERMLALDIAEMGRIREHFSRPKTVEARRRVGLDGRATDVELEHLGQAWSEHCKHKIFNADITYVEGGREEHIAEGIFRRYIRAATLDIQRRKPGFIKSVLWDNSGVVDLDPGADHYLCFKCETHNSPSFIEPYGGAITGIVGVYRDPMGTGRGSRLTFGVWGYCTGSPFYKGALRPPLHPDQLLDGIHRGVRDGGNKHGVPTAIGGTFFDDSYLGKCLVYVGAAGLIPKTVAGRPGYEKWVRPGDRIIVAGGRVGKDGIHGATASSQEYSEGTPAGHVQIGDPYTQKNVQEFLLEALGEGLIDFAQDSGAGGIGSAAGEMSEYSGGARIELDRDLFKYEGLAPWEILESESQERMFFAVDPANVRRFAEIAEKWDVEWRDIGEFTDSGHFHLLYKGATVGYLDIDFLHKGVPQKRLRAVWRTPEERGLREPSLDALARRGPGRLLHDLLRRENVASREFLQREYDTRVQGRTVVPAFIGEGSDVPSDAFVQKLEFGRTGAVACGIGLNPTFGKIDTYAMAMLSANEGLMRVVAVGADPDRAANNGNYCWPGVLADESDEPEYKTAQLVRAARAQSDFATGTDVATISGKDSMKIQGNILDSRGRRHRVFGLPAIQFATIGHVPDAAGCVTADLKLAGDIVYVVGPPTRDELGGSELHEMLGEPGLNVPRVDLPASMETYRALHSAMRAGLVESAKACSKGGLAAALSLAAFGGGLGASIDLRRVPSDIPAGDRHRDLRLLFSESASRFVVSVAPGNAAAFEKVMGGRAARFGTVVPRSVVVTGSGGKVILREEAARLKRSWRSTFAHKLHAGGGAP